MREVMVAVVDPDPGPLDGARTRTDRVGGAPAPAVFDEDGNLSAIDGVARDFTARGAEQERDAQIAMRTD